MTASRAEGGKRPVFIIAGPTASGKSALATELAKETGGWVINADAMQLYGELAILTARPDAAALDEVPHKLYGILKATDPASAARWRDLALAEIAACPGTPVLVGGTGLYIRALIEGLADIPAIAPEFRARAAERREALGAEGFHAELAARDPEIAGRLRPSDTQRTLRAWEVVEGTGIPLSVWQAKGREGRPDDLDFRVVVLDPPPAVLNPLIERRLHLMVEAGGIEELAAIDGLDPMLPLMKAVGVREFQAYRAGDASLDNAIEAAIIATRQYAKRQRTWFRHQLPDAYRVSAQFSVSNRAQIFSFMVDRQKHSH